MVRGVTRLCAYTSRLVAIFFSAWLPRALRIAILALFVVLNRCGRAYERYQYRAMVRRQGKKFVYRRRSFFSRPPAAAAGEAPLECAICLSEFVEGEVGRELEKCRHVFHAGCVEKWLLHGEGHGSCPLCRSPVVVPGAADVGESWKDERGEWLCFEEDLARLLLSGLPKICAATCYNTSPFVITNVETQYLADYEFLLSLKNINSFTNI